MQPQMQPQIIMTKGLPGSGKSTWAKEYMRSYPSSSPPIVRVNKDDLRAMMHNGVWGKEHEKQILATRDFIVRSSLLMRRSVIVDDTNFSPSHEEALRAIAEETGAKFVIQDFTNVPVGTCVQRDAQRPNPVGTKVIFNMYNKYVKKSPVPPPYDRTLPSCIIVDVDGTLTAEKQGEGRRGPFDWSRVGEDAPNWPIISIVRSYFNYLRAEAEGAGVFPPSLIIMSGRESVCREATEKWLGEHLSPLTYSHLYMRAQGDIRWDSIVKKELYDTHIAGQFNVLAVFDDRQQVVDMWRGLGLTVLQVGEGAF